MPATGTEPLTSKDFELRKPKILFWDIETAPNLGFIWGKYEQTVIEYVSEWHMLSWSVKWQNGKQITKCLADYEGYTNGSEDDKELVTELHSLLSSCDIAVAHNGDRFDTRKANTRFIEHSLAPPRPRAQVDTLKVAKKHFGFNSNKLDDLGRRLGVGRKVQTGGFELWKGCMQGDPKAWALMKKYNAADVLLLERVYDRLLPWIDTHPNLATMTGLEHACRNCAGSNLKREGFYYTRTGKAPRYSCKDCGAWMTGKHVKQTEIR